MKVQTLGVKRRLDHIDAMGVSYGDRVLEAWREA